MSEWIACKDEYPPCGKPVIVYGSQMSCHWPDIAYARWDCETKSWIDCFAYGREDFIRQEEVDYWLKIALPPGLHE